MLVDRLDPGRRQIEGDNIGTKLRERVGPAARATARVERPDSPEELPRQAAVVEELVHEPGLEAGVPRVLETAMLEVEHTLHLARVLRNRLEQPRDAADQGEDAAAGWADIALAAALRPAFTADRAEDDLVEEGRHVARALEERFRDKSAASSSMKRRFHHSKQSSDQIMRRWLTRPSRCSSRIRFT